MDNDQSTPITFEHSDILSPDKADESMSLPIDPQSAATLAKFAGQALNTYGKVEESNASRYKTEREFERDMKAIQAWQDTQDSAISAFRQKNEKEHVQALRKIDKKHKKQIKELDNESKRIESKHKTNLSIIDKVGELAPLISQSEAQNAAVIGGLLSQLIDRID